MPRGATPSRWCVCQFHHFGEVEKRCYLVCVGSVFVGSALLAGSGAFAGSAAGCAGGVAAGVAAGGVAGAGALASAGMIERDPGRAAMIVIVSDVTMKMIAAAVVALESKVAPVRWPNEA